jgi:hypothetical protein
VAVVDVVTAVTVVVKIVLVIIPGIIIIIIIGATKASRRINAAADPIPKINMSLL